MSEDGMVWPLSFLAESSRAVRTADSMRAALCEELVRRIAAHPSGERDKLVNDCLDRILLGLGWKKSEKRDVDGIVFATYADRAADATIEERLIQAHCNALLEIVELRSKEEQVLLTERILALILGGLGWSRKPIPRGDGDSGVSERHIQ